MARVKKGNKTKEKHLLSLPEKDLEACLDELNLKCKFNFSYIDVNQSTPYKDLSDKQQKELFEKLKEFSGKSLDQWTSEPAGSGGGHRFENYGSNYDFELKSAFSRPRIVPTDVEWARFRLGGKFRLAGFVLPNNQIDKCTNLDSNTFYVVFIDPDHKFYKIK